MVLVATSVAAAPSTPFGVVVVALLALAGAALLLTRLQRRSIRTRRDRPRASAQGSAPGARATHASDRRAVATPDSAAPTTAAASREG